MDEGVVATDSPLVGSLSNLSFLQRVMLRIILTIRSVNVQV